MGQAAQTAQIEAVWRQESPRLIAGLARYSNGDIGAAEELAQDAFVKAIEVWPDQGIPDSPIGWLTTTARNMAIDRLRRDKSFEGKRDEIGREMESVGAFAAPDVDPTLEAGIEDDMLRMIFTTCHPVLSRESRAALTLRMLGGLRTDEIARAFLASESTIGQRISRAKKTLADNAVPFEVPAADELPERLGSVLEVAYLIFNEGYSATSGDDLLRTELCDEAIRLCRLLAGLMPDEPEVHGLLALMLFQVSRFSTRTDENGDPVLLDKQDRTRWDRSLIEAGSTELAIATSGHGPAGRYTLQAQLAACHATAETAADTDWQRISTLYEELAQLIPSPIIELNRAVAVGMAKGPEAGLAIVDRLVSDGQLDGYHLLPAVRGDLLAKLGRHQEARESFLSAAKLTRNQRERTLFEHRADSIG